MGFTSQWASYGKVLTRERNEALRRRRNRLKETQAAQPPISVPSSFTGVSRVIGITPHGDIVSQDMDDGGPKGGADLQSVCAWARKTALTMRASIGYHCSVVVEIPVNDDVTLDSLALTFDISRPEITRCNGMSGRQILTQSILVPLSTNAVTPRTMERMEVSRRDDPAVRFMHEVGCDIYVATCYMSLYEDYADAVKGYHDDEAWEIDQAMEPPPYSASHTEDKGTSCSGIEKTESTPHDMPPRRQVCIMS